MVRNLFGHLILAAACVPSTIYGFLSLPLAPHHRLFPLASTTVKRPDAPPQANGVKVPNAAIPDFAPAAITVPLDGINPVDPAFERYKAISVSALDEWAEKHPRLKVRPGIHANHSLF